MQRIIIVSIAIRIHLIAVRNGGTVVRSVGDAIMILIGELLVELDELVVESGLGRMLRTARYKYVLFGQGQNGEQFFDMEKDPGETKNLIADRLLGAEVEQHRALLKQWMKDTNDAFGKAPARGRRNQRTLPRRTIPRNTTPFRSNTR